MIEGQQHYDRALLSTSTSQSIPGRTAIATWRFLSAGRLALKQLDRAFRRADVLQSCKSLESATR